MTLQVDCLNVSSLMTLWLFAGGSPYHGFPGATLCISKQARYSACWWIDRHCIGPFTFWIGFAPAGHWVDYGNASWTWRYGMHVPRASGHLTASCDLLYIASLFFCECQRCQKQFWAPCTPCHSTTRRVSLQKNCHSSRIGYMLASITEYCSRLVYFLSHILQREDFRVLLNYLSVLPEQCRQWAHLQHCRNLFLTSATILFITLQIRPAVVIVRVRGNCI